MKNDREERTLHSWALYASSQDEIFDIQKEINRFFPNYSFYPEVDWNKYGYRPPEGHQILGAWRHPDSRVFAFLLDNPHMVTFGSNIQIFLYIAGESSELLPIKQKIGVLKTKFELKEKKEKTNITNDNRLQYIQTSKSLKILAATLGLLTTAINVFSLYLRKLPPPKLNDIILTNIYAYSVATIHFSALLLFFVVIMCIIIFLVKYGIFFVRRI